MKKKTYQVPHTEIIHAESHSHLLDWSADKVPGGGGNTPEAKPGTFDDEENDEGTLPHFRVWED